MTERRLCPQCGSPIARSAPEGECPRCLMQAGLSTTEPVAPGFEPPTVDKLVGMLPGFTGFELIGRGGMGAVYRAHHVKLGRDVAIKVLPPDLAADAQFEARFVREARALARLRHASIVTLYDFGESDGHYYLVMEYVEGQNLRQRLQDGRVPPPQAISILGQICDALDYAHEQGVVHRDIKPENLLLDRQGRVRIADFGLARLLNPGEQDWTLTGSNQVLGTPHYMAPEQIHAPGDVDQRSDIYSLGVVFYEILTGELPLGDFEPPSRRAAVDARLDTVVRRSLRRAPDERYQSASELGSQVEQLRPSSRGRAERNEDASSENEGSLKLLLGAVTAVIVISVLPWSWGTIETRGLDLTVSAWGGVFSVGWVTLPAALVVVGAAVTAGLTGLNLWGGGEFSWRVLALSSGLSLALALLFIVVLVFAGTPGFALVLIALALACAFATAVGMRPASRGKRGVTEGIRRVRSRRRRRRLRKRISERDTDGSEAVADHGPTDVAPTEVDPQP